MSAYGLGLAIPAEIETRAREVVLLRYLHLRRLDRRLDRHIADPSQIMQELADRSAYGYMLGVDLGMDPSGDSQLTDFAEWRAARNYCTALEDRARSQRARRAQR